MWLQCDQENKAKLPIFLIPLSGKQLFRYTWMQQCFATKTSVQQSATLRPADWAGELQIIITEKLLLNSTCTSVCSEERAVLYCSLLCGMGLILGETGICRKGKHLREMRAEQKCSKTSPTLSFRNMKLYQVFAEVVSLSLGNRHFSRCILSKLLQRGHTRNPQRVKDCYQNMDWCQ